MTDNTRPDPLKLTRALEVFRLGGMTLSRMRECIEAWLLGADFSKCETTDHVFSLTDFCLKRCTCTPCSYDPEPLIGVPIGMHHCPECGDMVLAGFKHPKHHFDCYYYTEAEDEPGSEN